jgi:hypothetical protein
MSEAKLATYRLRGCCVGGLGLIVCGTIVCNVASVLEIGIILSGWHCLGNSSHREWVV